MFLPLDKKAGFLRPDASGIAPNDWEILSRFWYPVAAAASVKDKPVKGKLLDVDLVIFRAGDTVTVGIDRCPHRFIRLSEGEIVNDTIVCPYHSLAFNSEGLCVHAPALSPNVKLPSSYRMRIFRSEIRYGLVWACLADDSEETVPTFELAETSDPAKWMFQIPEIWPASAARVMENFLDLSHIPFVHNSTLGRESDKDAVLGRFQIEPKNNGYIARNKLPMLGGANNVTMNVTMPFTLEFSDADSKGHDLVFLPSPVSATEARVFVLFVEGDKPSMEPQEMYFNDMVNREDIAMLSKLSLNDLPLDESHEMHLPYDNAALQFRRSLRELGLGRG